MRLIAFIRWSRDAGWDATWYVLTYRIRTLRCVLFGHAWGKEQADYDQNIGACMQRWHDCTRKRCEAYKETFHYLSGHAPE